ncbi:MAG: TauD/TfdA family dioxygenase [Alphaproteobacteria bacterium]|nr:TauD/TfdA family dioxygenase [Alphaproteobacteria bacterium]
MTDPLAVAPLPGANFGGLIRVADVAAFVAATERQPERLPAALDAGHGLLMLSGLNAISKDPDLLVQLSRPFGREVENYRETTSRLEMVHPDVPQIFVVSNLPPVSFPPPERPDPPFLPDGGLPVQFPHRRGWHTDQSFRRPPPDISLFLAVTPAPRDQGQTLYADGVAAWESLPADLKARVEGMQGLHVAPFRGYGEDEVRAGKTPQPLGPRDGPQPQPIVRVHPVTGRKALYLCEQEQMDWINGPIVGLEPGVDGAGARLLYALMIHYTRPEFVYVKAWSAGDMVIYDNRSTIHTATWFDAERHGRVMWRTTVWGNPGAAYAGEARSWEAALA